MNTIKKIFEGKVDELVHNKFTRYGKGEYERFLIEIRKGKDLKIKTSWDWSNDLFEYIANNVKEEVDLTGKIVANRDFESEIPCEVSNYSKRGKLFTAEFKTNVSPEILKEMYEKFKLNFILLKVKSSKFKMSSGSSLPKPGGKIKENFCSATLPLEFLDEFVWEVPDFKVLKIRHQFNITEIIVPEEFKKDPAKARLESRRKGTIKRVIDVDGKEQVKEINFEV